MGLGLGLGLVGRRGLVGEIGRCVVLISILLSRVLVSILLGRGRGMLLSLLLSLLWGVIHVEGVWGVLGVGWLLWVLLGVRRVVVLLL